MRAAAWCAVLAAWTSASAAQDDPDDAVHTRILDKVAPSVVGVRAMAPLGEVSGTGVFLDDAGLILTSYHVVSESSADVRVWTLEPRKYAATVVGVSRLDDIALIRIKPRAKSAPVELGESSKVKIGDVAYTLGNANNSLIQHSTPSFNLGLISGLYNLRTPRSTGGYVGWVFETTAAVNPKMEGAALLDAKGRMTGVVTLNFSPQRWLGNAVPIDYLKPRIQDLLKQEPPPAPDKAAPPAAPGTIGMTVREDKGRLVVDTVVKGGPAEAEGVSPGMILLSFRGKPVRSAADFNPLLEGLNAGDLVFMEIDVEGAAHVLALELAPAPKEGGKR